MEWQRLSRKWRGQRWVLRSDGMLARSTTLRLCGNSQRWWWIEGDAASTEKSSSSAERTPLSNTDADSFFNVPTDKDLYYNNDYSADAIQDDLPFDFDQYFADDEVEGTTPTNSPSQSSNSSESSPLLDNSILRRISLQAPCWLP